VAQTLSLEQKRSLYRDGYVIVKQAVAGELVEAALARMDHDAPNRCGLVYLPEAIRELFLDESSESTPDGKRWTRPTQILMEPGDACITVYQIPHSGSRNEHGTESRKSIIFRIRNKKRQPDKLVNGVSDHPDRGQMGEWLDFEEGNDPWERSKQAMCNIWQEWEGMQEVVAEEESSRTRRA
jgi:hypothetical protein